ncbi:MAG: hypothetical protein ABDH66_04235 [Bacteroidia bacterium]
MRFYIVAATTQVEWGRRIRALEGPTLIGCIGPQASTASKQLSAALSEIGIPSRWLPIRRRPSLLEETLHQADWNQSLLSGLLKEVPVLILDAEKGHLHRLWGFLNALGEVDRLFFFPSCPVPAPLQAHTLSELREWAAADEALQRDLLLAADWLPCTITPYLS